MSLLVGPARLGTAASARDFANSSAGGARGNVSGSQNKAAAWGVTYSPTSDSLRNDYNARYVHTRARPQNYITATPEHARFSEYPKLEALLRLKHQLTQANALPPTHAPTLPANLPPFHAILITPPATVDYEELRALQLPAHAPGFLWLWVGTGQSGNGIGLEQGRQLLAHWGYRRCEDIVWLKTNHSTPDSFEQDHLFHPSLEHCLMGIKGTVRRSTDPWFVHCNVDTDLLVWEGDRLDQELKPPELQSLIENFCQGTRRLHLYASPHSLRRGWLSIGPDFLSRVPGAGDAPFLHPIPGEDAEWTAIPFERTEFLSRWEDSPEPDGTFSADKLPNFLPFVQELDALRPKSPPLRNGLPSSGGLGRGRGAGLGITRNGANGLPANAGYSRGRTGAPNMGGGGNRFNHHQQQQHPSQFAPPYQFYPPAPQPMYNPYAAPLYPSPTPFYPAPFNGSAFNPTAPQFYPSPYHPPAGPYSYPLQQQQHDQFLLHQQWLQTQEQFGYFSMQDR